MAIFLTFIWFAIGIAFGMWYYQSNEDPVGAIAIFLWMAVWFLFASGPVTRFFTRKKK